MWKILDVVVPRPDEMFGTPVVLTVLLAAGDLMIPIFVPAILMTLV